MSFSAYAACRYFFKDPNWIKSSSGERDLKSFLVKDEWKELTFKKKDLSIIIEYKGKDVSNQQYNYSVNYCWDRKS